MEVEALLEDKNSFSYQDAIRDFRRARRMVNIEKLKSLFTGESTELLAYDDVIKTLKITGYAPKRVKEIPLDAIIGSVGRYQDFTRNFLPKEDFDQHRWAKVQQVFTSPEGAPPIEVYQVDDVYFVIDGNHRVSVARQLGAKTIEAYVTEIKTAIPLTPDTQPDDLIIKAEYKEFLKHTRLDELVPDADFSLTVPGKYEFLEMQIASHAFALMDRKQAISLDQAIVDWYKKVYRPVIKVIRERGLLRDFPERTETDLYIWISEHRQELKERLGWRIRPEIAAIDYVNRFSPKLSRTITRIRRELIDRLMPEELTAGPETGTWRRERMAVRRPDRMFSEILVPLSGDARGWCALDQALVVARREESHLYGLHVVATESRRDNARTMGIIAEFKRRCQSAGIPADFAVEVDRNVPRQITDRVGWTDLAVINLVNPPGKTVLKRWKSPFRTVARRSSRPILAVPQTATALERPLLAYDGSPKANEALYLSTYFAAQWHCPLVVVFVQKPGHFVPDPLERAKDYLKKLEITATYVEKTGPIGKTVIATAEEYQCDLIVMGGYDLPLLRELLFGSNVEKILRKSQLPMLICR